jgi:hypothetical protein
MREEAEALPCLEQAYRGHSARGDARGCVSDAHVALVVFLVDVGAMDGLNDWLARAQHPDNAVDTSPPSDDVWWHAGVLAGAVFSASEGEAFAANAAQWLTQNLGPLKSVFSPDERLLAAQVLINYHLAHQSYEQFDLLASIVESPELFAAASPFMRARWCYTLGFAQYQIGNHDLAQQVWTNGLNIARASELTSSTLITSLALLRLLIDRRELAQAEGLERSIDPRWGAGRAMQLVLLQQMRARLLLGLATK